MQKVFFDIETTSLEGLNGRILCIVTMAVDENGRQLIQTFCDVDEKKLLEQFWDSINTDTDFLIGFNSDSFDVPFIVKRSLVNRVRIKRLHKGNTMDLRKVVNSFFICYSKYERGTLGEWAQILGIPCKTVEGAAMKNLYEAGDWKTIVEHCQEDINVTKALYERCIECGLL